MRLASSSRNRMTCGLCDWQHTGGDFADAEAKLLDHLRYYHNRLPIMISRSELKQGYIVRKNKKEIEEMWPVCSYDGPRYGKWEKI